MVEAETGRFIKFNTGFVGDTNLAQHNGDSTTNRAYLEVVSGDPDPTGYEPVFAKEGVGMTTCGGTGTASAAPRRSPSSSPPPGRRTCGPGHDDAVGHDGRRSPRRMGGGGMLELCRIGKHRLGHDVREMRIAVNNASEPRLDALRRRSVGTRSG